jgi:two-component system nitrate/nitrite response regulator NarL
MRLLIADDHAIFRAGLRLALEANDAVDVVVEASSFDEMLELAGLASPDVLIVDLQMPGLILPDGLKLARRRFGSTPVLILSASSDAQDMIMCLGAGASGYVTKTSEIGTLFDAIKLIRAGGIFVPADVVAGRGEAIGERNDAIPNTTPRLTRRQAQVLELVLDGHANKEIAYRLAMSEGTVKTHLASVMRMYDVNNRVQLLRQVERVGFRS